MSAATSQTGHTVHPSLANCDSRSSVKITSYNSTVITHYRAKNNQDRNRAVDSGLYLPRGLWELFLTPWVPPRKEPVASRVRWLGGEHGGCGGEPYLCVS